MAATFEDVRIDSFQPKNEKDPETGDRFDKVIFKGELRLNNTLQVTDLFAGFRKKLNTVKFTAYDQNIEPIVFSNVSIEDFTCKSKNERIGKGQEAEVIPVEITVFKMAMKILDEGDCFKQLYSIFKQNVEMVIE